MILDWKVGKIDGYLSVHFLTQTSVVIYTGASHTPYK